MTEPIKTDCSNKVSVHYLHNGLQAWLKAAEILFLHFDSFQNFLFSAQRALVLLSQPKLQITVISQFIKITLYDKKNRTNAQNTTGIDLHTLYGQNCGCRFQLLSLDVSTTSIDNKCETGTKSCGHWTLGE